MALKNSKPVKVIYIETNIAKLFVNYAKAAKYLGIGLSILRRSKAKGKLYCQKYQIIKA